jgi:PAS domain S-box-containing protein
MTNGISSLLTVRFWTKAWPILAVVLLPIQAGLLLVVNPGASLSVYSNVIHIVYFLLLLLATGIVTLNAIRSGQTIRLFWLFFGLGCGLQAVNAWTWVHQVTVLGKEHPDFLLSAGPLYLHIIFLIAAVVSRPHLKLSRDKPFRTTLNLFLLLFFFVFAYAIVLFPISQYSADVLRAQFLYSAENLLLLVVLGAAVIGSRPPWKVIYRHLLGASTLYALGSLAANLAIASGRMSAGWYSLLYTAAAYWFVWVALQGRELAPQLEQTAQVDTINPKYVSTLAMLAVVAIPIVGVWELFRSDRPYATHVTRLLIVFLALLFLAITAFMTEYFTKRELSSDVDIAHDRLRMAMAAGKSVGWEWDLASGRNPWFGDLQTMFGISSDTFAGQVGDFRRYLHPDDRERVLETITSAQANHMPYEAEFRVVRRDGMVRWVAARGVFSYARNGDPERMLGMAVDVTERKQAEEALRRSEEKFSKAFRQSPMAFTLTSARDLRYVDVNETFERITGWQREEVIGRTPLDIGLWVDPSQRVEFAKRVQTDGVVRNLEFLFRCKNGEQRVGLGSAERIEIEGEPCIASVSADITERKQAQEKLLESENRLSAIVASAMDAIITVNEHQQIVLFNPAAEKMFGCAAGEAMGSAIERFIPQRFRSEHKAHIQAFGESGITKRAMGGLGALGSLVGIRTNGEEFPIEASISHVEGDGTSLFTIIIRDITERKQAENAVRESEQRFRLVANTAPVLIWMSGTDKLCNYFNQPWLEFTGRPLEAEMGNGWTDGVHPEDLKRCLDTYTQGFDRRESFQMQYRLRRQDGEYRWVVDIGVPRFNPDGSFAGYIGSCIDITDRRRTEEALANMGRRLIEAHEEERTWIARELHDDINQRIALLAIELERWNQCLPESAVDLHDHIHHARERLSDVAKDIQSLSHRLHSSKLEYLGIVAAAKSFCKELSEQHNVRVEFNHADIPRAIPKEISLCLFRVLQEALQNAVKHSGARHFHVELRSTSEEICLTVSDPGVGFDRHGAMNLKGLGLISMRERLQLVNGEFSIDSEPDRGTTIYARVPLRTEENRVRAAG